MPPSVPRGHAGPSKHIVCTPHCGGSRGGKRAAQAFGRRGRASFDILDDCPGELGTPTTKQPQCVRPGAPQGRGSVADRGVQAKASHSQRELCDAHDLRERWIRHLSGVGVGVDESNGSVLRAV